MDKLANYGSDDDYDDSPRPRRTEVDGGSRDHHHHHAPQPQQFRGQREADVNYDEVQMDMSEDTDSSSGSHKERAARRLSRARRSPSPRSRDSRRRSDDGRRDAKQHRRDDRYPRDKYQRSSRRRSSSRDRRSRSPPPPARRNDYRGKRSSSRERDGKGYGRKYVPKVGAVIPERIPAETQRPEQPAAQLEKKPPETERDRFFMPGITGRFRDQIERRKLLWQKKDDVRQPPATTSTSTKVWQTTTFAQDADGKVASKFKRLMGIKDQSGQAKQVNDVLKRQEEMFSSMEQQYEVARTATHTMRGVGLGFGSYQR